MGLLDARGNPISSVSKHKKAPAPQLGEKFAPAWMGDRDRSVFQMPGGGTVMFDLSRLRLADFRAMKDHYQINATLAVMTFMIHQMDWSIECDNAKIRDFVTENLKKIWTPFIRAVSQAYWAGYSPNVLQWENDLIGSKMVLTKVKDIIPEEASVNWDEVEGWAPEGRQKPKIKVYDGIKIFGQGWPTPTENSFWYPLMMENGDMYGKKLLRPVFTSWYFSLLMHLFSNRYFERFGEPVPVGRASYEDEIDVNGTKVLGADLMVSILQNLRNRSVVVLPNDRSSPTGNPGDSDYDYQIEYLESQMRGADFERYLMRLDEEMSIGLFTPLLILRTADVGSYNLGTTHWNMYLNMLNALVGDLKSYTDPYIIDRMVDFNFGTKAPRAVLKFRKMGDDKVDLVKQLLQALMTSGTVKPDLKELGDIVGLTLSEVEVLTQPDVPTKKPAEDPAAKPRKESKNSRAYISKVSRRISNQLVEHVGAGLSLSNFSPAFGAAGDFVNALELDGFTSESVIQGNTFLFTENLIKDLPASYISSLGPEGAFEVIRSAMAERLDSLAAANGDA